MRGCERIVARPWGARTAPTRSAGEPSSRPRTWPRRGTVARPGGGCCLARRTGHARTRNRPRRRSRGRRLSCRRRGCRWCGRRGRCRWRSRRGHCRWRSRRGHCRCLRGHLSGDWGRRRLLCIGRLDGGCFRGGCFLRCCLLDWRWLACQLLLEPSLDRRLHGGRGGSYELSHVLQHAEDGLAFDSELFRKLVDTDLCHCSPCWRSGLVSGPVSCRTCSLSGSHRVVMSVCPPSGSALAYASACSSHPLQPDRMHWRLYAQPRTRV